MVEKIGHIKNPLTVIAIFAAIAEISGTTVLPFIESNNQSIYIWFLMLFPVFLISIFFLTLNFNHKVLYAPSDYKDERHFVDPSGKATPEEQGQKLHEEVKEIEIEEAAQEKTKGSSKQEQETNSKTKDKNRVKHRQLMADVTLAEKLAVNKLSKELGFSFKTDVRFDLPRSKRSAVFDAFALGNNEVHAVEVKLFKANRVDPSRFARVLESSELVAKQFIGIDSKDFVLHIFVVMDTHEIEKEMLQHSIYSFAERFNVKVKVHITTLNDLQNEYQYNP